MKVKLAAIAKDEAAYLPAWIFHHLHFGFDEIEVWVNNTSDNTNAVLREIAALHPVRFRNADHVYEMNGDRSFQLKAYDLLLKDTIDRGFTHLLFLDVDEFWTPMNFQTQIHDALAQLNYPDVVSFEWANKMNETAPFSRPFEAHNPVRKSEQVKSLFRTDLRISALNVHNVQSDGAVYVLGSGQRNANKGRAIVNDETLYASRLDDYFLLHRMWRSPVEYAFLLGRGMNQAKAGRCSAEFEPKTNRTGYLNLDMPTLAFDVDEQLLTHYDEGYREFVEACQLAVLLKGAEKYVVEKAKIAVENLRRIYKESPDTVGNALNNYDLDEIARSFGLA